MKTLKKQVSSSRWFKPSQESSQVVETVSVRKKLSIKPMPENTNPNENTQPQQAEPIQFVEMPWDVMRGAFAASLARHPKLGKYLAE